VGGGEERRGKGWGKEVGEGVWRCWGEGVVGVR